MEIEVTRQPCDLYEAVELLRAFVNQVPLEKVSGEGEYCIPTKDMEKLMEQACKGIKPDDPQILRFFRKRPILGDEEQWTCLASCMVYSFMEPDGEPYEVQMERMCATWERMRRRSYCIQGINFLAPDFEGESEGAPPSLAAELKKLPIEEEFFLDLLETFSDYAYQMEQLRQLLAPVIPRLSRLLKPYVKKAAPLEEAWRNLFRERSLEEFVENRGGMTTTQPFRQARFTLRYLDPKRAPGRIHVEKGILWMLMGVGVRVDDRLSRKEDILSRQELEAFRLLGGKGAAQLIQALTHEELPMQELASRLGQNPGTVFRGLNSLANAELLIKEMRDGRYYYRANMEYIRTLFDHMLQYYETGRIQAD